MKVAILAGGVGTRLSGGDRDQAEADGRDRRPADPLAHHEALRPLRASTTSSSRSATRATYIKRYMRRLLRRSPATSTVDAQAAAACDDAGTDGREDWTVDLDRHRPVDARPAAASSASQPLPRRRDLHAHLGRRRLRRRPRRRCSTFHRAHGKLATVTAVRPPARFGHLELDGDQVVEFSEKPQTRRGLDQRRLLRARAARSSTTSTATTRSGSASRSSGWRDDGQLMAYRHTRLLAVHGHAARQEAARGALGRAATRPGRSGSEPMRVLVTGHDGYIGTVLVPMLAGAGHEVVGLDSDLFDGLHVRRPRPARRARRCARTSATSRPTTSRVRRGRSTSPRISNDPLGDLNPETHLRHQPPRPRSGWRELAKEAGVARFLFSSSCSLYGAAGDDCLDETAAVQPGHAVRRVEGARRAGPARSSPTTTSARPSCATRPPTASRRGCAATSSSTTSSATPCTTGEVLHQERRHAVAAARAHRGHRARLPRRCSRRRASVVHDEAFNVGAHRRRTTGSARSPTIVEEVVPGSHVALRRRRRPRRAQLPRQLRQARRGAARRSSPQWTVRRGVEELYDAYQRERPRRSRTSRARGSCASRTVQELAGRGPARRRPALATAGSAQCARRSASTLSSRSPCRSCGGRRAASRSSRSGDCRWPTRCCARTQLDEPEPRFPLDVAFCPDCSLVQILETVAARGAVRRQLPLLLVVLGRACSRHSREHAARLIAERAASDRSSLVVELARNDGYLLQQLRRARRPGARASTRRRARPRRPSEAACRRCAEFFGAELADRLRRRGQARRRDHRQQRAGARAPT